MSVKCQQWVLYLEATRGHDIEQSIQTIPSPRPPSPLPETQLLAVFYGFIRKLISSTPLFGSLSVPLCLAPRQYFTVDMSLPSCRSQSPQYFIAVVTATWPFLLGDYFIMRPQLPPSPSPASPPPFSIPSHLCTCVISLFLDYFYNFCYRRGSRVRRQRIWEKRAGKARLQCY